MKTPAILIVDDEEATIFGYSRYLSKENYTVETARCLSDAREKVSSSSFDLLLLDLKLPDGNSIDWIQTVHTTHPNTSIIVIT